jgi:hypothetical protein
VQPPSTAARIAAVAARRAPQLSLGVARHPNRPSATASSQAGPRRGPSGFRASEQRADGHRNRWGKHSLTSRGRRREARHDAEPVAWSAMRQLGRRNPDQGPAVLDTDQTMVLAIGAIASYLLRNRPGLFGIPHFVPAPSSKTISAAIVVGGLPVPRPAGAVRDPSQSPR